MLKKRKILTILGIMSGTSADGVDCAVIQTDGLHITQKLAAEYYAFNDAMQEAIKKAYGTKSRAMLKGLEQDYTQQVATIVQRFIEAHHLHDKIDYIGWHGQTIYHNPAMGETLQIGDGDLLAHLVGHHVIYDFRTNDVKNGGEGAPLAPIYHKALCAYHHITLPVLLLNIGGISNITYIDDSDIIAFDCGIGNNISDDICALNGLKWDEGGALALQGTPDIAKVNTWLMLDFFAKKPPKSLDRQFFHDTILQDCLTMQDLPNMCATLAYFLAKSVEKALHQLQHHFQKPNHMPIMLLGGGVHNKAYSHYIQNITQCPIIQNSDYKLDGDFIEAEAFAYLAARSLYQDPISFPLTTNSPKPLTGGRIAYAQ